MTSMKMDKLLRAVGVIGVVALYGIYSINQPELSLTGLGFAILGVVALVSPEVVDQLPFGPTRGN